MTHLKNISVLTLIFMVGMVFSTAAFAMDLQAARDAGVVGERLDGYIGIIKMSAKARGLMQEVNGKRLIEYKRISKENNQPVDVVAKIAAKQIIAGLSKGHYYQAADGSWQQK